MPLDIPPLEWPKIYNMVNLGGIDLATANGSRVPGIYQKITAALTSDNIEVFYNWKFADIVLPPSKVVIDVSVVNQYTINEEILVKSDDTVGIIGFIRIPVIIPLTAEENKVYDIPIGADGFGPVTVQVPIPTPSLVSLNVTENGVYQPSTGEDGFSDVTVEVPQVTPVLIQKQIVSNGIYRASDDNADGYSEVSVGVPPVPVADNFCINWDFANPINTRGQSIYTWTGGGDLPAIDGWILYAASMELVSGGIIVEKVNSGWGAAILKLKSSLISYLSGKTMTVSIIVNGRLYTRTFTYPTAADSGTEATGGDGSVVRIWRTSGNVTEITIDAALQNTRNVIRGLKFEFGSNSTFVTDVNGVLVYNQPFIIDAENFKKSALM